MILGLEQFLKTQILSIMLALFIGAGLALAHQMLSLSVLIAHNNSLDKYGCHRDNQTGNYHCHRVPCVDKTFASQADMLKSGCSGVH